MKKYVAARTATVVRILSNGLMKVPAPIMAGDYA
jgi:hypothetical protein